MGARPKEIGHLVAHDRARIRSASLGPLAFGEPWRAGCGDNCLCFMKNVKFARSPLVTVFQSPAQLPACTITITELSCIEIEEGTGVSVLKFSTLWLKHCPLAIVF